MDCTSLVKSFVLALAFRRPARDNLKPSGHSLPERYLKPMDVWQHLAQILDLHATQVTSLQEETASTAEPQRVIHWLQDYYHTPQDFSNHQANRRLWPWLRPANHSRGLITLLGNSPFLAQLIKRWPEFLDQAPTPGSPTIPSPEELTRGILATHSWDDAAAFLRKNKQKAYFYIGFNDLTGLSSLEQTVHALSDLGQASLEAGYRWLDHQASQRHGPPMIDLGQGPQRCRFCILGMGKLGARELNFSSDVDLIYLYDDDHGQTAGPTSLAIKSYYNRLGKDLIRLLSQPTEDGIVFRLDLRLRPEGESGDLAVSRRSAEIYYESWGQTWERSAMIKARPVAGDLDLGAEFLKNIEPFVFRRYLDFTALDAIRQMKQKIDRKIASAADTTRNCKLGYGGIREIEFFVQSQQLIHGGKKPQLRHRETLTSLKELAALGLLTPDTVQTLERAYLFLRTLEHRLQIEWERQTHSLPEDGEQYTKVAKRMGLTNATELKERYAQITRQVHTIYDSLFFEGKSEVEGQADGLALQLLQCNLKDPAAASLVTSCGFAPPESALSCLSTLRDGPRGVALTEHDRLWYGRVALTLLQGILNAPDPNLALHHMGDFLKSLGHRVSYLAMLYENRALLELLLRLFGTSSLLSHFLVQNPYLLDALVGADFIEGCLDKNALGLSLAKRLETIENTEDRFDAIRIFKNTEMLRIGIRDLSGLADCAEVMGRISILAEVILQQILQDAMTELTSRHGVPQCVMDGVKKPVPFAILAMGKLGGRELNYASDLDLIFIHGGEGELLGTDGHNALSNAMFFARLGQKIISHVTTLTRHGLLYELDMRLRPSGQSGPLVTSLESFIHYHQHESWLWEHQALIRARFVAGDAVLGGRIQEVVRTVVLRSREPSQVFEEVGHMRLRIYNEKKPSKGTLDLKQSLGGVVDIEFLVQALILIHGAKHPEILQHHCGRALHALDKAGLLPEQTGITLQEAYDFYRLVENRLRLLHNRSENLIPNQVLEQNRLARLCQLNSGAELIDHLYRHMKRVDRIVSEYWKGRPAWDGQ
ncbi:MAG: bifunctional [glutamate--ammonia ligase]-adenylyl-L-tyrosine phosphorylase/[glutamate--ammonia-ligase] adenylyltransferase [Magnetococcales bacterium]|nr:bifunctional [glutamate--ammonia ligase]-adenylyl-L-tyrosine phosphorylase/[glutamate--ammonia-ligase] adenylyltransferase [Magnetococcales bacterium]